ncbi:NAD(P)H-hydrate epimerase [Oribacterium sp. WCC10]|uniref:NAD(P)H-hydrate epimerase n=1 Tax=Oribacterium sp. WCC10 TaxID=1855343 RepID=UPI0008F289C0|nr:NAD(P)H-hydrate epimerase [Oribacterium sp. WCC10]SFG52214.1 NAD(P)H-hydrate epimerase [Oribacterium sp. WCC10]
MPDTITGTVAKRADRIAMDEMDFESLALMETASSKIAIYINRHYTYEREARILVLAGVGNNGADAVAAARMLKETGYDPVVFVAGKLEKASWEFLYQMFHFQQLLGRVNIYREGDALPDSDICIDGIFGIGLHRPVEGIYRSFMEEANAHTRRFTIAIDAPSGINTDTGELMGCGIKADVTITFGKNKTGLVTGAGKEYSGTIFVEDIGIPEEAYIKAENCKDIYLKI